MDKTCLRLKFTPFIKKSIDGSRCCLEITPEISSLENLDTIQWNEHKNHVEYDIPIVYKLVIKKNNKILEFENLRNELSEESKVFHSCIDVSRPFCDSEVNLAGGDVVKYRSDNYILENAHKKPKDTVKITCIKGIIPKEDTINDNAVKEQLSEQKDYSVESNQSRHSEIALEEAAPVSPSSTNSPDITCEFKKKTDDSITTLCDSRKIDKFITLNQKNDIKNLAICPMCTISACDSFNNADAFATLYERYIGNNYSFVEISNENLILDILFRDKRNIIGLGLSNFLKQRTDVDNKYKTLTELRIQELKSMLKHQLLPLKMLFDEVAYKFAALDLSSTDRKLLIEKNKRECAKLSVTSSCLQKHTNRVTYSVVFDG